MKLAVTTIQRNRGKWIVEWLAFHMLVGFDRFFVYAHKSTDNMTEQLLKLARRYDIHVHQLNDEPLPQLLAYQHAYNAYGGDVDWMAFIDGDEFLHPTGASHMGQALAAFEGKPMSALAAYWVCYGGNGHVEDPDGLVMQDYPRHSGLDFVPNRHVKTIVRGRQQIEVRGAHLFETRQGTTDTLLRPITQGWMRDLEPAYEALRINHYAVQSYDFFRNTKQNIGAADGNPKLIRPSSWYFEYDRNECDDGSSYRFLIPLKLKVRELQDVIVGA
jgi:glycosyltransferase involved in cell wall biosynthesis